MRFYHNPSLDPTYNMALEEVLLGRYPDETFLMLWQNPATVVCGKFQNLFEEVCVDKTRLAGVHLVRRNTGGGTVWHGPGNLNYTVIAPRMETDAPYERFLLPVITALCSLGVPAEMGHICDIAVEGKKISGSAQAVVGDQVLHHGTLLFDADLPQLIRHCTREGENPVTSKAIKSCPAPVTNIKPYLRNPSMTLDDFAAYLRLSLCDGDCVAHVLTTEEESLTRALAVEKYGTNEWTYGKCPAFVYERTVLDTHVRYEAKKGRIAALSLTAGEESCPLAPDVLERVSSLLVGLMPLREELTMALSPHFAADVVSLVCEILLA